MSALQFGKVPYPAVVESHLPFSNPMIEAGAPAIPAAVFWHRMIGSWNGTDGWFHAGHAATAYGVAVADMDGAALAGSIYEWISPASGWYGESSGPADGPYGDGAAYVAEVGVGNVNRLSKAIEISGNYDTPLDEKSRAAIVALTAYFADQARIPWDSFPAVPGKGRSFVIWHNEITGLAYKECPGRVVMDETPDLIARIKDVLKAAQTGGAKPQPKPAAIWWARGDVGRKVRAADGQVAIAMLVPTYATPKRDVPLYASIGGAKVGTVKAGAPVVVAGTTRDDKGKGWYLVETPDGFARARGSSFADKLPLP